MLSLYALSQYGIVFLRPWRILLYMRLFRLDRRLIIFSGNVERGRRTAHQFHIAISFGFQVMHFTISLAAFCTLQTQCAYFAHTAIPPNSHRYTILPPL